jgi:hypothetical protein
MFEQSYSLNETLKTYPIDSVINGISRSSLVNKIPFFISKDVYRNIAYFQCDINFIDQEVFEILRTISDRRGYFISHIEILDNGHLYIIKDFNIDLSKYSGKLNIVFESKYNKEFKTDQKYLYHCTTEAYIEKIKKIGLVPKSKSKITFHPERIYLALNKKDCRDLITQFIKDSENYSESDTDFIKNYKDSKKKYVILRIEIANLNLKLMEDPNCKDYWGVFGVYTVDSIPPSSIFIED